VEDLMELKYFDFELLPCDLVGDENKPEAKKQDCSSCLAGSVVSRCLKRETKHEYRRAFSESKLLDMLDRDFTPGATYHCISGGDIDSLSFLKHIIRQQNLDYLLFSTWCMADDDVLQFREWVEADKIKRLDAYCGEIFPGSYSKQHRGLKEVVDLCAGRVAIFRNHAKIYAGVGDKFSFAIESSANINTNPRTENTTITVGADIFGFYKEFFDGIKSYKRDYDEWTPWRAC
jgi:hypothetical protein